MIRRGILALCLLLAGAAHAAPIRVVDDAGLTLELVRPPQRIVSLTPHLTELLFAVGAGAQAVGVDSASDYPEAARGLPRVGDYSRVNFERILALKPELVLVWLGGNRPADVHGLKAMKLPLLHTRATRLDDVARLLRLLGRASGHPAQGERAAQQFAQRLAAIERRYARGRRLPVFYQVWDRPLMTVGGGHWISEALAVCGARNIFADLTALSPVVSREAVLQRAPEVIISGSDAPDVHAGWRRYSELPAVRTGAFVRVDADRLHRPSPRLLDGVVQLCESIAPYER
ncbi:MAG: cobalamin-binding protein [Thiobacillus sp.]